MSEPISAQLMKKKKMLMMSGALRNDTTEDPEDPYARTEAFCKSHFANDSKALRTRLSYRDLPWPVLPTLAAPGSSSGAGIRRDFRDGQLTHPSMVFDTEVIFSTFNHFCKRSRIRTSLEPDLDFSRTSEIPKICLILHFIDRHAAVEEVLRLKLTDSSLPLSAEEAQSIFGPPTCNNWLDLFLSEQYRFFPRTFRGGVHVELGRTEPLPFKHVQELGRGNQGSVDEVEFVADGRRVARKHWRSIHRQARRRLLQEVAVLERLDPRYHVVQIVGSYTRKDEFGLLHTPVADCDLWQALSAPTDARRQWITDEQLRLSLGCLCVGLANIHRSQVRHKDLKTANILISQGSLLFTDFGLSLDITDYTNSITTGGQGTRKYFAPELSDTEMEGRRAPAEIFALGCILLEIWSVLIGWPTETTQSFTQFAPFYQNLTQIHDWIARLLDPTEDELLLGDVPEMDERDIFWLDLCGGMVKRDPEERSTIDGIIATLKTVNTEFCCCMTCQTFIKDFEPSVSSSTQSTLTAISTTIGENDDDDNASLYEAPPPARPQVSVRTSPSTTGPQEFRPVRQSPVPPPQQSISAPIESPIVPRTPSPSGSTTTTTTLNNDNKFTFIDCLNRKFQFPYDVCKSWDAMRLLIQESVPTYGYEHIRYAIWQEQYNLAISGKYILSAVWEHSVYPGCEVQLELWPSVVPDMSAFQEEAPSASTTATTVSSAQPPQPQPNDTRPPSHTPNTAAAAEPATTTITPRSRQRRAPDDRNTSFPHRTRTGNSTPTSSQQTVISPLMAWVGGKPMKRPKRTEQTTVRPPRR